MKKGKVRSLFIGRFQPFHEGHKAIVDKLLDEGKDVVIAVRDTPISEKDPYTYDQRVAKITSEIGMSAEVARIPDFDELVYGRKVGYKIRKVRLNKQLEEISGTKTRNSQKKVIWLTGNTGSGKTSIAYLLKERLNAIILDGDEMRASISTEAGFSEKDRDAHNMRVARLAEVLRVQGHNVIVSVIAPFQKTRDKIDDICSPYWIYIRGGAESTTNTPYEPPSSPHLVVDPTEESLLESMEKVVKEVGEIK